MANWILNSSSTDYAKQTPYLADFLEMFDKFDEYPNTIWKLNSKSELYTKQIPYKVFFPEPIEIDDIPKNIWILDSSSKDYSKQIPYKKSFPLMYSDLDYVPKTFWTLDDNDTMPNKRVFPELLEINDYPDVMWTQEPNHLPYKKAITYLAEFTDYPDTVWREKEGHYPYKVAFPFLYKFTDVPHNMWVIDDEEDCPFKSCFPDMGYFWDRNIIDYVKPDYYFEKTVCIGDRILRAVDLEGRQAIRHISIIPTNLITTEVDYDVVSMLKTSDGLYLEIEDEDIEEPGENDLIIE